MKKIYLFIFLLGTCFLSQGQTINENFNTVCDTGGPLADGDWIAYNDIAPLDSLGWKCTPTLGRDGTPGMVCSGQYSGAYHLDTAWLFTPAMTIYGLPDSVYMRFDSKYDVGYEVGTHKTSLLVSIYRDSSVSVSILDTSIYIDTDVSVAMTPVIGGEDSIGWVTHTLNLTPFASVTYPTIRAAFRYISTDTVAGDWFIDNVNTSYIPVGVRNTNSSNYIQLSGNYNDGRMMATFYTRQPGDYLIALYDIEGRELLKQNITATGGKQAITLDQGQYHKGLYILRMWNDQSSSEAKVVVY